jgi:hypothetical protein
MCLLLICVFFDPAEYVVLKPPGCYNITSRCSDSLTQQLVVSYSHAFLGWTDANMFGRSCLSLARLNQHTVTQTNQLIHVPA